MFKNYPDIIQALIAEAETDRLRYLDLSSFMTGPSLKEVYEKIDKTVWFFSVYVYMEELENDLWDDDRYVEKKKVVLCSQVEEEARKYWWNRSMEHIRLINERMESLKNEPEYKDIKENDLKDKIIEDMTKEVYPIAIERLKDEYQEFYEDKWEEYWEKEEPFKERVKYQYHRRYEMPPPFNHWDSRNYWQQYYFYKDHDGRFYYTQGGSGSSGRRYDHGFYGHLFALLNNEKKIPTYFFIYNSRNQFIFNRKEESLHLHFFDLVGNFKIDWKESDRILKDVTEIKL